MTSGLLDGAEALIRPEGSSGESYEAPSASFSLEKTAAERFMIGYQTGSLGDIIEAYKKGMSPIQLIYTGGIGNHAEAMADLLGIADSGPSKFHANTLLERIIDFSAAELPAPEFYYYGKFCDALTLLIQTLYFEGHNDFVVDLSQLNDKMAVEFKAIKAVDSLGTFLMGRADDLLRLTTKGDVNSLGTWAHNCQFTHQGNLYKAGDSGRDSYYDLSGSVESAGIRAEDCRFFVDSVGPLLHNNHKDYRYSWAHDKNRFTVRSGVNEEGIRRLQKKNFWGPDWTAVGKILKRISRKAPEKYNTLFVPDGADGWTEVLP